MRFPCVNPTPVKLGNCWGKMRFFSKRPGFNSQFQVVVARESLLREPPEVAVKLLRALSKAAELTRQRPGQAKAVMASWLGISLDKAEPLWPVWEARVALDESLLGTLESASKWAIQQNLVARRDPPAYRDLVDDNALQAAIGKK